jgi:hypothetical protein
MKSKILFIELFMATGRVEIVRDTLFNQDASGRSVTIGIKQYKPSYASCQRLARVLLENRFSYYTTTDSANAPLKFLGYQRGPND